MPLYEITGPGGKVYEIEGPPGATKEQIVQAVQAKLSQQQAPVETAGLGEALKGGAKQFGRTFGTGIVGAFAPEEAAQRFLKETKEEPIKQATSLEALKQKYLESGFFPAAGEALSQIPGAIAEQLPNLAATAAGARLGAMAGAPLGLPGVIGGGVLGAATPSLIQSFGQNIGRQAEEQRAAIEAGAAPDISRGAAAAAAVPQAALDVAAQRLIFGKQLVARVLGRTPEEIAKLEGKALVAAERKAEKIAKEGLAKTLSRGVGTGFIGEVPTEVAQQMLERAQAGLPLFDDEAKQEYLESAYGAALVSPLGAVGSISERGAAREGVAAREAQRQLAEQRLTQLATGVGGVGENYAAQQALLGQYDTLSRTRAELKERRAELEKTGNRIGLLDTDEQLDALEEQEKQLQEQAKELNVPLTPSPAYAGPQTIEAEIAQLEKQYGKAKTVEDRAKLRDQLRAAYARLEQLTAPEEVPAAEGFTAPEPKKRGKKGAKAATAEGEVAEAGAEAVEEPEVEVASPLVGPVLPKPYTPEYGEMLVKRLQDIETETQRPKGVGLQAEKNRQANLFNSFNTLLEDARNLEFSKTDEELAEDRKDAALNDLKTIEDRLNTLKERFIESATDEIRLAREETGVAPISDKELSDTTDKMDQLLTEIANRTATPNFNKRQGEAVDPEQERFNFSVAERRRLVEQYGLDENIDQQLALLTREINKLSQQASKLGSVAPSQRTTRTEALAETNAGEIRRINAEIDSLYKDRADLLLNNLRAQLARIKNEAAYGAAPRPSIEEAAAGAKAKVAQRAKEEEVREAAKPIVSPVEKPIPLEVTEEDKAAVEAAKKEVALLVSELRGMGGLKEFQTAQGKVTKARKELAAMPEQQTGSDAMVRARKAGRELEELKKNKKATRADIAAKDKELQEALAALGTSQGKIQKKLTEIDALEADRDAKRKPLEPQFKKIEQARNNLEALRSKPGARLREAKGARTAEQLGKTVERETATREEREADQRRLQTLLSQSAKTSAQEALDNINETLTRGYLLDPKRPLGAKGQKRVLNALNKRKAALEKKVEEERIVKAPESGKAGLSPLAEAKRVTRLGLAENIKKVRKILFDKKASPKEKEEARATLKDLRGKIKKGAISYEAAVPKLMQAGRVLAKLKKRGSEIQQILSAQSENARKRTQLLADAAQARREGRTDEAAALVAERKELEKKLPNVAKLRAEFEQLSKQIRDLENRPATKQQERAIQKAERTATKSAEKIEVSEPVNELDVLREAGIDTKFSMDADGNVFRRGSTRTPVAEAEAKATIAKVKVPKGVKFEYAYTYDALPDSVKAQLREGSSREVQRKKALEEFSSAFDNPDSYPERPPFKGAKKINGAWVSSDGNYSLVVMGGYGNTLIPTPVADFLRTNGFGGSHLDAAAAEALENLSTGRNADEEFKKLEADLKEFADTEKDIKEADEILQAFKQEAIEWAAKNKVIEKLPNVKGAVLPDGTVVIIGNAHSNTADIQKTIAHEVVGHYGVDMLLGPKGMKDLTDRTMRMQGGIQKLAESFGKDVGEATLSTAIYYQRMADQARADGNEKRAKELEETGKIQAMRELIAHVEETRPTAGFVQKANRFIKELVGYVRAALRKMGLLSYDKVSTSDIYKLLRDARKAVGTKSGGVYVSPTGEIAFRKEAATYNAAVNEAARRATGIVGSNRAGVRDVLGSNLGLQFVTRFVDRFAPLERVAAFMKDSANASEMIYFLRMHDQNIAWAQAALTKGPLKLTRDEKGLLMIKAERGPNIGDMVAALKDANVGNPEATKQLFTTYLLAERAEIVGYDKLKSDLGDKVNKADLKAVLDLGRSNAAFQKAKKIYNDHNNGLLDFLIESGAMSKEVAQNLRNKSYVPYYREDKNGNVEMVLGGEKPISVGNVKDQPYLHELVGGNKNIIDVFASSIQNTRMLTDMALRNLATRNAAFGLQSAGMLKDNRINNGSGPAAKDVIRFKIDGEEKYAVVDSDKAGIPSELLVSGMEGVKVVMPLMVRMLSVPAGILRKFITRNPVYALRQLERDSTTNYFLTGTDALPLGGAAKNLYNMYFNKEDGSMPDLQSRGIISGNVLTGTSEQMEAILLNMVSGKPGWEQYMAKLDILAQRADEASRISIYNDFRKQGLSDMEATIATLESMNFNKRGTSPSIFMLNAMVPFLNAQIQGLNVLVKSLRGTMPFAERLKQRKKLVNRAMFMVVTTAAYAMMMSDDEAYENSDPVDRYNNWFVRVPGFDEPVRVPIPFEVGLLFKAIPEAMIDAMRDDAKAEQAYEGMKRLFANSMPLGPSSLPAGIKPIIELTLGSSFYTGMPIESEREKRLMPEYRTREKTTEISKAIGSMLGVSPIQVDYMINGYFSSTGMAVAGLGNFILRSPDAPQPAEKTLSEMPVIGALFQTNTGSGYVNTFYRQAEQIEQAKATFDALIKKGDADGAARIVETSANDIAMDGFVSSIKQQLADIREAEKLIRNADIDPKEKAKTIKDLRISAAQLAKAANLSVSALQ